MSPRREADERRHSMLRTALGPDIAAALDDPTVTEVMVNPDGTLRLERAGQGIAAAGMQVPPEVMVNPDGTLRLERAGQGIAAAGMQVPPEEVERLIRLVASHVGAETHADRPILSAELPTGERFEGLLPPVVTAPCFVIRKPAARILTLADYVGDGILSPLQADALRRAVRARRNILVAGGTASGKTTLTNALLAELAETSERLVLIEDTRELQCAAPDCVALRTRPGVVSLRDLVRSTLRLRPDRIIVGEVRGGEALDLLKAWNTGHPGGIATLHANSAQAALYRLEQLAQEAVVTVPCRLIAEAVDLIVHIQSRGGQRRVDAIARTDGLDAHGDYRIVILGPADLQQL